MASNSSSASGGIGLGGAVFLVFLVLKLTKTVAWSWWWVTYPLWGPLAFMAAMFVLFFAIRIFIWLCEQGAQAWRRYKSARSRRKA